MITVSYDFKDTHVLVSYDDKGNFQQVIDGKTCKPMMIEFIQSGPGYKINPAEKFILEPMLECHAMYIQISELKLFIPKYLFIPIT